MRNKRIVSVVIIIVMTDLFIVLIQWSDHLLDFIPFVEMFERRSFKIQPYDLFIGITLFLFRHLYKRYGVNLSVIKSIPFLFYPPIKAIDIAILVGTGLATYSFICPFLFQFFAEPILSLSKYTIDSIRHTFMVALIFGLIFILSILSRNSSAGAYSQAPPNQPGSMPPPTW
jgi:hypothetical protein